ncbi:MAG TPA: glycosyltransferase family 2 protein, partial [Candidatus Thermoplasmatota archaeon]|nr:glycosyltransferase family 2 protein [Candidatus Thermoplasmatota archaeon]
HTPACVESVLASTYPRLDVLVVDNASTDGSREAVETKFPQVRVVRNDANVGFGPAIMRALPHARGEHLLVLNNDIEVDPACIERLVCAAREGYAAVAALITFRDRPGHVNGAGGEMHYLGLGWPRLYERKAFEEVGGFDEDFFLYVEDADLSWRLRLAGHRIALEPRALMRHDWDFARNQRKFYLIERNRLLMLAKNWSPQAQLVLLPAVLLFELAVIAGATTQGWGRLKLQALRDALRGLPGAWRSGRTVLRRRHEADVARAFQGSLRHPTLDGPSVRYVLNPLLAGYWRLARGALRLVGAKGRDESNRNGHNEPPPPES